MTEQKSPCCTESNPGFIELDAYIDSLKIDPIDPERKEKLIMTLHKAQSIFGYLPAEVQKFIANRFAVSHAHVSGVIRFYNYFTTTPKGKTKISICMGTACYVNGANKILQDFENALGIKAGQVTPDGRFSIETLRCVGACVLAPVVLVNDHVYGKVKQGQAEKIIEEYLVEYGEKVEEQ